VYPEKLKAVAPAVSQAVARQLRYGCAVAYGKSATVAAAVARLDFNLGFGCARESAIAKGFQGILALISAFGDCPDDRAVTCDPVGGDQLSAVF
jgi:hypothetical protein